MTRAKRERKSVWTPALERALVQAWAGGADSPAIGALLGVTGAAVRGKRRRLGLPARSAAALAVLYRERGLALGGRIPFQPPRPDLVAAVINAPPLRGSTPRPLMLRLERECAWPVSWHGEAWSCCLPTERGSAYCHGHRAILRGEAYPPADPQNVVLFEPNA